MSDFYSLTTDQQAARLTALAHEALTHWGLADSEVALIKHRENGVYSVRSSSGERYALRVHRAGYHSDAELHSELIWMRALDDYGIHTPPVIAASDGDLFKVVSCDGVPEPRQCDLLAWIDGQQLGSIEDDAEPDLDSLTSSYRLVGALAAKLHNQTSGWSLPPGFTRHAWDVDGLVGADPFWGRFWELEALTAEQAELIQRTRTRVRAELESLGQDREIYSLIHADFLPENLLLDGNDINLIDFDDAGFGWHLFEFATSLFFHIGEDSFEPLLQSMIDGYREHRQISDEHLAHLPTFLVARGLTYLGWLHTRKETETAQELTPMIVEGVTALAEDYLSST